MPGMVIGSGYVGEAWIGDGSAAGGGATVNPPLFTNTNSFFGPKANRRAAPSLLTNPSAPFSPAGSPVAPVTIGTNTGQNTLISSPKTVFLPSGIQSGDILLCFFSTDTANNPAFPAGWTKPYNVAHTSGGYATIALRVCDGTEGASISVTIGGGGARAAWVTALIRGSGGALTADDIVIASNVNTSTTSNPDPPSLAFPSGGKTHQNDAVETIAAFMYRVGVTSITAYPTNYTDNQILSESGAPSPCVGFATRHITAGASVDPGTFTVTTARPDFHELTLSIRSRSAGVRHSYKPALHTNNQTFYSANLPPRAPLFTNSQIFHGPRIRLTVKPALHTNNQTFYGPTRVAVTVLQPPLFTNANTLFGPRTRLTVKPALLTNSQSIFAPSARRTVRPSLFTNPNTFYGPRIRLTVRLGGAVASTNAFFGPTIAADGTVSAPLFINTNGLFAPSVTFGVVEPPAPPPQPGGGPGALAVTFGDPPRKRAKKQPEWPDLPDVPFVPKSFASRVVQPGAASALAREASRWQKAYQRKARVRKAIAETDRIVDALVDEEIVRIVTQIAKE